jgi:BMFP domain-containing protein YqiC
LANATNDLNTTLQTRIEDATNDLDTAIRTDMAADIAAATNDLNTALQDRIEGATNELDTAIRTDMAADIATATNNLNTALQARIEGATNTLDAAIRTDLNLKLDREDGTATNLTVKEALTLDGAAIFTKVADKQSVAVNGEEITVANLAFKTIESADVAHTAGIAAGSDGQNLVLQGASDAAFPVTITNNPPAVVLAAGVNFTMNTNDILQLIYNGGWKEINRVDN